MCWYGLLLSPCFNEVLCCWLSATITLSNGPASQARARAREPGRRRAMLVLLLLLLLLLLLRQEQETGWERQRKIAWARWVQGASAWQSCWRPRDAAVLD